MQGTTIQFSDGSGSVVRYAAVGSQFVAARHVDVWCPPGYGDTREMRSPVIYRHDGQNRFDPATIRALAIYVYALGGGEKTPPPAPPTTEPEATITPITAPAQKPN